MSTTAEKLTYLNTTKTLIKDNLNLGGANISNEPFRVYSSKLIDIYKDFLANGTDTLWNNWNKVNGTGENLTLNNTIKGKMKIDLKGNTSQEGTPTPDSPQAIHTVTGDCEIEVVSKNLFDSEIEIGAFDSNGKNESANTRLRSKTFTKVKPSTTYTLSWSTTKNAQGIVIEYADNDYNSNQIKRTNSYVPSPLTITTSSTTNYIRLYIKSTGDSSTSATDITNIMLNEGSTATTYEPYIGSSYPIQLGDIELCKIGDYQDVIKRSSGKNLNDGINDNFYIARTGNNFRYSGSDTGICIEVEEGNYTISTIKSQTRYRVACSNSLPSNTNQDCYNGVVKDGTSDNITINTTGYKYLLINCTDISSIMINEGSTALPYEPYGKVWYKYGAIGKVVLDGSESWSDFSVGDINFRCQYDVALPNILTPPTNPAQLFSNYFKAINRDNAYAKTEIGIAQYGSTLGKVFICAPNTILSEQTLASWKTWLSTHNTIVYYILATPTNTEITDSTLLSQLEAIKLSYNEQTNISQENNDKPFILDVTALGELEGGN